MLLSQCPKRVRAKVAELDISEENLLRLHELGLRPGVNLHVVNRAAFGGVVVNIDGARVAVDRRRARHINVEVNK